MLNQMVQYVFLGLNKQKHDKLITVKTFPKQVLEIAEMVFCSITELSRPLLNKKLCYVSHHRFRHWQKSGVNKRLLDYLQEHCGRTNRKLGVFDPRKQNLRVSRYCQNRRKKKGPGTIEEESLITCFKNISKFDQVKAIC